MSYRGVVLDVDGTVVRGDEPIPGAAEGLDRLSAAGLRRLFVSNNPTKRPPAYADRLRRAGFDAHPDEIVTAGTITTAYLAERHPDDALFVVGENALVEQLTDAGLTVVTDEARADTVVVSIDRSFDYDRLCAALRACDDEDVTLVGTDPDMVIPAAEGDVPGSGAIINAVAGVVGRKPDVVLGKPSKPARRMIRDRLDLPPRDCLVVGDRLDTDIALGERAGMTTVLVRTGVTDDRDLERSDVTPDYVLDSLGDVGSIL
ncbi:HAD-IIA family hydrolase [Haloplanus aerogenes]|uniref:4-nitrophenyl phosphatase n=1 Tax=Haloplanus aerogenes TaxID=660522 RepID=A0A3M0D3J0_9EURY|nr:HAD-IIA family hydrolase [Haloplanus aerogenes]AZH25004.1 HAD-IIA family hydrolase [Haloplanus aerogenes]RMB13779.1 4-nitrophenyl phosphatase [Haloplanus aerogenes]